MRVDNNIETKIDQFLGMIILGVRTLHWIVQYIYYRIIHEGCLRWALYMFS